MMIKERSYLNPTVQIPPYLTLDDPTFPNEDSYGVTKTLPWDEDIEVEQDELSGQDPAVYESDQFRMFEFKVRRCTRGRSHDWTECPFVHPGEKARRRDPSKYHYSGTACPEFRKGNCKKGDTCEYGHGVFECWLHPSRYRTQPCKDGAACPRRVCFFAHSPEQLRLLTPRTPDSAAALRRSLPFSPPESPPPLPLPLPLSSAARAAVESIRQLHLSKVKSMPCSWRAQKNLSPPGYWYGSTRPGFFSLPTTPTGLENRVGSVQPFDLMERVESGRDLRAKMFAKLGRENFICQVDPDPEAEPVGPDVGWVSDLLK